MREAYGRYRKALEDTGRLLNLRMQSPKCKGGVVHKYAIKDQQSIATCIWLPNVYTLIRTCIHIDDNNNNPPSDANTLET